MANSNGAYVWSMAVNITYTDGSTGFSEVRHDDYGYEASGVNVGRTQMIREFVTSLGLTPKTRVDLSGVSDMSFRFSFTSAVAGTYHVAGDTEEITVESDSLASVRPFLTQDINFSNYFLA